MEQNITIVKQKTTRAVTEANELQVRSTETLSEASELLTKIKTLQKAVKQEKDKVLQPLLEATKAERARWEPIEDYTKEAENIVKDKMIKYNNEVQAKARAEEEKVMREFEAGKIKKIETVTKKMEAIEVKKEAVVEAKGNSQFRTVKKVKIVDENLIPDVFWELNLVAINKAVLKDGINVPGTIVIEETVVAGSVI